jgi:bacterioferritin-associated ferredoxin
MLTEAEVHQKLREIASRFGLFQCQACADEMRQWLQSQNMAGVYLTLVAYSSDFIISERVGSNTSITQNGRHYGVEAYGKVFDNLPGVGLSKQEWLDDFECLGGFELEESSF